MVGLTSGTASVSLLRRGRGPTPTVFRTPLSPPTTVVRWSGGLRFRVPVSPTFGASPPVSWGTSTSFVSPSSSPVRSRDGPGYTQTSVHTHTYIRTHSYTRSHVDSHTPVSRRTTGWYVRTISVGWDILSSTSTTTLPTVEDFTLGSQV